MPFERTVLARVAWLEGLKGSPFRVLEAQRYLQSGLSHLVLAQL